MAKCPRCNKHFREPEGERGEHDCLYCGYHPLDDFIECPRCEYIGIAEKDKTIEGADRDGNRGVVVTWLHCPECGENVDDDCQGGM